MREVENRITKTLQETAEKRAVTFGGLMSLGFGVLGFLGYRKLSDLEASITKKVSEGAVDAAKKQLSQEAMHIAEEVMSDRLRASISQVLNDMLLIRFKDLASEIDQADSVDPRMKNEALSLLQRLAEKEDLVDEDRFGPSVDKLLDSLFAANMVEDLEFLFDRYSDLFKRVASKSCLFNMTRVYACELLGERYPTDTAANRTLQNFRRFSDQLVRMKYPEIAYAFLLPYFHSITTKALDKKIEKMKEDIESLSASEQDSFLSILHRECAYDHSGKHAYFRRYQSKVLDFVNANKSWLETLGSS